MTSSSIDGRARRKVALFTLPVVKFFSFPRRAILNKLAYDLSFSNTVIELNKNEAFVRML
ncbi:hypothetical protein MYP_2089 [Sporocytophaga myxococcoides]|uniref:Uncharacterized protein n=1 Tax=Sporocytophaga myxococcoides TaxID=153721 RepID=A0A098LD66_9BACT|nr:hypothetical protein MYP_2089 [Sporocytophaga myxococcoides]